jgi:hypothetical protein
MYWCHLERGHSRPATAGGIHAATMALPLCTSPSGLELLGSNESNLPLDSRFRGNDCLRRPARKNQLPQMTSVPQNVFFCPTTRRFLGIFFALIGVLGAQKTVRFAALKTLTPVFSIDP